MKNAVKVLEDNDTWDLESTFCVCFLSLSAPISTHWTCRHLTKKKVKTCPFLKTEKRKNSWGIDNRVPASRTICKVVWHFNKKCPWYSTAARLFRLKTKTSCIAEFWPKQRHQMPSCESSTRGCEKRWPSPPPTKSAVSWTPNQGGFLAQLTSMLQSLHTQRCSFTKNWAYVRENNPWQQDSRALERPQYRAAHNVVKKRTKHSRLSGFRRSRNPSVICEPMLWTGGDCDWVRGKKWLNMTW